MDEATALQIKQRYESYLKSLPGVTAVGFNNVIKVYVDKITPEIQNVVPSSLEGVRVVIIESGKFRLFGANARTGVVRPVPGGVSIGHPLATAGTLGCLARDMRAGKLLGLSNNHVIALQWGSLSAGKVGDPVLQPGPYDGGIDPQNRIGELERWVPVKVDEPNKVDAAAFSSDLLAKVVEDVGYPLNTVEAKSGMNVIKSGRTSGVTYGRISDVNATIKISGDGDITFTDCIIVPTPLGMPGDSGSWVGQLETFNTVGLLFAGSDTMTVLCKATNVEQMLDVQIIPPTPIIPWYVGVGALAMAVGLGYRFLKR